MPVHLRCEILPVSPQPPVSWAVAVLVGLLMGGSEERTIARTYRVSAGTRLVNRAFAVMTRLGLGKPYRHILTVPGRRTGTPHSTPVDVMARDGERWLVAAYGTTNWVRNARAAGQVTLSRGGRSETLRVTELDPAESVPVLRQYLREVPVTRPYFAVTAESADEDIAADAPRHPVFRLTAADLAGREE